MLNLLPAYHLEMKLAMCMNVLINIFIGLYILSIFNYYRKGIVFNQQVIQKYIIIGVLFMSKAVQVIFYDSILFIASNVEKQVTFGFSISTGVLTPITIGLIICAVAWIMQRALKLQQENEYTV